MCTGRACPKYANAFPGAILTNLTASHPCEALKMRCNRAAAHQRAARCRCLQMEHSVRASSLCCVGRHAEHAWPYALLLNYIADMLRRFFGIMCLGCYQPSESVCQDSSAIFAALF